MNSKYERQLKKGVLEILVLKLLDQQTMYGYQIIQTLKDYSNSMFLLKEGTLYHILYRLEDEGCLTSFWSHSASKDVPKKFYKITEKGKQTLKELSDLWTVFSFEVSKILEDSKDE